METFCVNLNIHYTIPQELWVKVKEIFTQMPGWTGFENGCPKWYGDGGKIIEGSLESSGLQLYAEMPQSEWDTWLQLFKDKVTVVLGYPIGEPEDGYTFPYWLYRLIMTDSELSYDDYKEEFDIGVFETEKQAIETAKYYLANVQGFCDYPCTYRIEYKKISDCIDHKPDTVWIIQGWNTNDNLDEIDIIESSFFLTEDKANQELEKMKMVNKRTEWAVSRWKIGELKWRDGFIRV